MSDISLLVVRPEVQLQWSEIAVSLEKRGYSCLGEYRRDDWDVVAAAFYGHLLIDGQLRAYLQWYVEHGWGFSFLAALVQHQDGDTLQRLVHDKGPLFAYQTGGDRESLRAEFGRGAEFNVQYALSTRNGYQFAPYNGFHAPTSEEELRHNLRTLGLEEEVQRLLHSNTGKTINRSALHM